MTTTIIVTVCLAAVVLALLAVGMAWVLGWANRAFHVEVDPKVEAVIDALPGANCGGCGFVGCGEYAAAIARGEADVTLCAPGGAGCARRLAEILGVEVEHTWPYRAVVHCAANYPQRLGHAPYEGEPTCEAANLVGAVQGCTFGCLGLGDCTRACDYDAIHLVDGLATVDYEKCIGCKACAKVCPRNIISMVPFKSERMVVVACSNKDRGAEVKRVCTVGCIGCTACSLQTELMAMQGHLPVVDYEAYDDASAFSAARKKCPRESMLTVGHPSPKDLAAVADETVPDRVEADFKTTVDDTEWRG